MNRKIKSYFSLYCNRSPTYCWYNTWKLQLPECTAKTLWLLPQPSDQHLQFLLLFSPPPHLLLQPLQCSWNVSSWPEHRLGVGWKQVGWEQDPKFSVCLVLPSFWDWVSEPRNICLGGPEHPIPVCVTRSWVFHESGCMGCFQPYSICCTISVTCLATWHWVDSPRL